MHKLLFCTLSLGVGIWIAVSVLRYAELPEARYSGKFGHLYQCIYNTTGPADAVVFGSSRVRRAKARRYLVPRSTSDARSAVADPGMEPLPVSLFGTL